MSEPAMERFHISCYKFCTLPCGQYSPIIISFRFSQPIELATNRVGDLTRPFHHVRALREKVQAANLTLIPSGHEHISKTESVFSHHHIRAMTPPSPLKGLGLQFMKSLHKHSRGCPWVSPWLVG